MAKIFQKESKKLQTATPSSTSESAEEDELVIPGTETPSATQVFSMYPKLLLSILDKLVDKVDQLKSIIAVDQNNFNSMSYRKQPTPHDFLDQLLEATTRSCQTNPTAGFGGGEIGDGEEMDDNVVEGGGGSEVAEFAEGPADDAEEDVGDGFKGATAEHVEVSVDGEGAEVGFG
jgi:hypothetical protein